MHYYSHSIKCSFYLLWNVLCKSSSVDCAFLVCINQFKGPECRVPRPLIFMTQGAVDFIHVLYTFTKWVMLQNKNLLIYSNGSATHQKHTCNASFLQTRKFLHYSGKKRHRYMYNGPCSLWSCIKQRWACCVIS